MNSLWLTDKVKAGEIYTNTNCFTWCLKCYPQEKRIEAWGVVWGRTKGYQKTFQTEKEALFAYRVVKGLLLKEIPKHLKRHFEKI